MALASAIGRKTGGLPCRRRDDLADHVARRADLRNGDQEDGVDLARAERGFDLGRLERDCREALRGMSY